MEALTPEILERTESTNLVAAERARAGAPHGTAILAREQTGGRGRRGRSWSSPPNAGLYVSFVLRPRLPLASAPLLTIAAGLAMVEAAEVLGAGHAVRLKWPNDLLVEGGPLHRHKLGGVLVDLSASGGAIEHAIVGIGLNLRRVAWPPEVARLAAALEDLGAAAEPEAAYRPLAAALYDALSTAETSPSALLQRYQDRAAGLGEQVSIGDGEAPQEGRLVGFGPLGGLILEAAGVQTTHYAGDLRLAGMP
ncbi:MAG: biotin--[acetyl-CoA-carboxylase] ligase [Myxococcota bacterium]